MNFQEIASLFCLPRLVELRWLGEKRWSMFTSDSERIESAVCDPMVAGLNTYIVINPLQPDVPERRQVAVDRVFRPAKGQCSADSDISRRILLPLDWDPVRKTGTAATEAQRSLAATQADVTLSYLSNSGFPDVVALVDSGNGRHAYFRFDAANSAETGLVLTSFYVCLARKFDTAEVGLDKSVRSAAQLMRLPGSYNHKAQRTCELLSFNPAAVPVSLDMVRKVTDVLRGQLGFKRPLRARRGSWTPVLLEAFLEFYNIDYLPPTEIAQGFLYVLNPCPLNPEHMGSSPAILLTKTGFPKLCCKHASCQMSWKQFRGLMFRLTNKPFLSTRGAANAE